MAARPDPGRSTVDTGAGPPPAGLAFASPQGRWTLLATVLGSGIAFLDSTVVTVALPRIGADLDAGVSGLQWVLNGYLAALSALILLGGSLGDRFGRRRVFVAGVVLFTAASVACALAPTIPVLVVGRAAQGVGGALLTPGSLAILEASFRPDDRARAIGAWSGLTGIAAALGPFLGGWLVDAASWRWIFLINVPISALVVTVTVRHVPESLDPGAAGRLDVPGALLAAVALGALSWGMIAAGDRGWAAPAVLGSLAVGAGGLAAFAVVEARSRWPMMPRGIFRVRQFTAANLVTLAVYAALGGVFFLLVVHLQEALGYSALEAGAASLPITVLMLALSSRSGALAHRIGPRLQMSAGPIVLAAGVLRSGVAGDAYVTSVLPAVVVGPAWRPRWRRSPPRRWARWRTATPGWRPGSTRRWRGRRSWSPSPPSRPWPASAATPTPTPGRWPRGSGGRCSSPPGWRSPAGSSGRCWSATRSGRRCPPPTRRRRDRSP